MELLVLWKKKKTGYCQSFVVTYWVQIKTNLPSWTKRRMCKIHTSKKGRRCTVIYKHYIYRELFSLPSDYIISSFATFLGFGLFLKLLYSRKAVNFISNLVFPYVFMNKNALNLLNLLFCIIFNFKSNLLFPFIIKAILSFSEENENNYNHFGWQFGNIY